MDEQRRRASLRVAWVISDMWNEKQSSHSRLLDSVLFPREVARVGSSKEVVAGEPGYDEHIVPLKVVITHCHCLAANGASIEEMAAFIRESVKIVRITPKQAQTLNTDLGLRDRMPPGWRLGGDCFARLREAQIEWVEDVPSSVVQRRRPVAKCEFC